MREVCYAVSDRPDVRDYDICAQPCLIVSVTSGLDFGQVRHYGYKKNIQKYLSKHIDSTTK